MGIPARNDCLHSWQEWHSWVSEIGTLNAIPQVECIHSYEECLGMPGIPRHSSLGINSYEECLGMFSL